jgi:hypothetical protein
VADVLNLYLDDSGTRNPDRNPDDKLPAHGHDWFGLGGVMVREAEERPIREAHADLYSKWQAFGMAGPLHSSEIRAKTDGFRWLRRLSPEQLTEFYGDVTKLATRPELTTIACVIDRPGYNRRYRATYGNKRWLLCKTAFSIVVERAAKYARRLGCKLRVNVERGDKTVDALLKSYYDELRGNGQPFNADTSAKYAPLAASELARTLHEFQKKNKSSPPMQLADLCLWPVCIGGYDQGNVTYVELRKAGALIDCKISPEDVPTCGIKYSCWDVVVASTTQQATDAIAADPDPKKPKPGD